MYIVEVKNLKAKIKQENTSGFTVVEILVVLLIIGVLTTILLLTYSGIEQHQRNNTRIADIKLIQSNLETYYAESGFYPTLVEMNDQSWTETNLKGLDQNSMIDPGSSFSVPTFAATLTKNEYTYAPTSSDGKACNDKTVACAKYTLSAQLEASAGTFTELSLN